MEYKSIVNSIIEEIEVVNTFEDLQEVLEASLRDVKSILRG